MIYNIALVKNLIILIVFFLSLFNLIGQSEHLDSTYKRISIMADDSTKAYELIKLCNKYLGVDIKKAIHHSKEVIALSKKIKHKKTEILGYYFAFVSFATHGKVDSCMYYANLGEKMAEQENELKLLSDIYSAYVQVYQELSDNKNAIKYGFKNIELMEKSKNNSKLGRAYSDLSDLYLEKYDTANALKFVLKSYDSYKKTDNVLQIANMYRNAGNLKWSKYDFQTAKNYYLKAIEDLGENHRNILFAFLGISRILEGKERLEYLKKAENASLSTNVVRYLPYIYLSIGDYYKNEEKDYSNSIKYYIKGIKFEDKIDNVEFAHELLNGISEVFIKTGEIDSAIFYINKSMATAKKLNLKKVVRDNYFKLYTMYKKLPNSDSALHYLELSNIYKDSIYNNSISQNNAEAYAKYETGKKEAQIVKQKLKIELEEKRRNRIIFGGIALLLLSGLIFQWFVNRQRRKNKETELALKLKDAESKNLKELNDSKSRFFANITHEFRTPLTLIIGPLQDVIGKIKGENKEILKIAHSNSKRLLTLVNDILDLSTLEEGSPELNKSNVCLFAFLKRVFYSYESYAKIRQISTEMVLPPNKDVLVNIDLEKLEKIINNLLSNAFKYTETGGSVKLLVDLKEEEVFIEVKDTGVGIDEKDIKHIFERYYQGSNSENITGTGIGLSFADRLAKMMGGSISVESKRNEGSTFTLQIPLEFSKDCPENMQETEIDESISGKSSSNYKIKAIFADKPRVLIVEDNYEMQKYLSGILKEYFHIDLAENGFEGLKKLKENKYDLVSSDVMMPGMDGFVFRQEINKNLEWRNIPFILLTARSLKEDKLKGFKLGIDDYITKPFNAIEYIARINNLIKNKQEREKWIDEKSEDTILPKEKSVDNEVINEIEKMILKNIDNPDFNVSVMATKMGYSPRNLSRLTKKLIGLTPVNLILEVRLQKAYQLLKSNKYKTVSEVRYEVGIDNASYFSKKFTERFGVRPGDVA